MNFVKKIVPYCLYLLLIIFIVFGIHSIIYTQGRFVFWCEDLFETYLVCLKDHNFFDVLNLNHHHSMLYSLYCNLFRLYIPGIFAVHPLTFFDKITSFINSFIIFELLFVFSACFLNYFPKRKFWMNLIACLLIFPAFAAFSIDCIRLSVLLPAGSSVITMRFGSDKSNLARVVIFPVPLL